MTGAQDDSFQELSAVGFAGGDLDRQSERREDAAHIAALQADAEARAYLLVGDEVVLDRDAEGFRALFTFAQAADIGAMRETVFLGHDGVGGVFAASLTDPLQDLGPSRAASTRIHHAGAPRAMGRQTIDLRTLAAQGLVSAKTLGRLAQAKSLLYWHARHRFCANCGQPTIVRAAGWKRSCAACGAEHFPRTDPVVIMLAVDGERCLLGRQPRFPTNMYSALAGFVEGGETLEAAVRRELKEEAGIEIGAVTYRASQPWPFPCSVMIGCLAQATTTAITIDSTELEDARWFSRAQALALVEGRHPDFFCPPKLAIAHHLLAAWARSAA